MSTRNIVSEYLSQKSGFLVLSKVKKGDTKKKTQNERNQGSILTCLKARNKYGH